MKIKAFSLLVLLLSLALMAGTSSRTVTGKITDAGDGSPLPGVNVLLKGSSTGAVSDVNGEYQIIVPATGGKLVFSFVGFVTQEVAVGARSVIDVALAADLTSLEEVVVTGISGRVPGVSRGERKRKADMHYGAPVYQQPQDYNTEEYEGIEENIFHDAANKPLSTFSIDVDAASYANVRRFISQGQRPPVDAVRIEELINYFDYDYEQPKGEDPFSIYTEISEAPWNTQHKLVHIGLQGKKISTEKLPPSNLVFLIDVSGSMADPSKLPLLKSSFKMLVEQLRDPDRVAIVVYAGAAGQVLPSTRGDDKRKILESLDQLEAGGSTAGGAGIRLAYEIARKNFVEGGNNRVILATDGDFNVGESSDQAMEKLIEQKREEGVFLTVLGFGMGNYKDSKMEVLADKGNGNYAYIDNILEAQKVLVNEFGGTLFTIAKDVKLQIEFNPARVQAYRLIGYENRLLKDEDFNNDKKDAGELGSGHTVTALYEVIPVGVKSNFHSIDPLKYQTQRKKDEVQYGDSDEIMTIKFRYKKPDGNTSKLLVHAVVDKQVPLAKSSDNFRWSAAVAAFGMLLRDSEYVKGYTWEDVAQLAGGARGRDEQGYRIEFINLVKSQGLLVSRR
jgi:Ca-activated chloride channel family protein